MMYVEDGGLTQKDITLILQKKSKTCPNFE